MAKDQEDHREKERKKKRDKNQQEFVRKIGRLKGGRSSNTHADEEADDDAIAGPAIQYDDAPPSAAGAVDGGGEAVGTAAGGGAGGHINLFADEEVEMKKAEAKHHKYLKEVGHTNQVSRETTNCYDTNTTVSHIIHHDCLPLFSSVRPIPSL